MSLSIRLSTIFYTIVCVTAQNELLLLYQNHLTEINASLRNEEISDPCLKQLGSYYNGLVNDELWAWQIFDAKTKVPSGLLAADFFDLGNFDECLEAGAKYCLSTVPADYKNLESIAVTKEGQLRLLGNDSGYRFASCVPNRCTAEDASRIYPSQNFVEKYCYSKETIPDLSPGAVTTIVILGVFGILVTVSTSYDVWLHYKRYKPGNDVTIAFSCFTNGRFLLSSSSDSNKLLCLDGLRAITMMWLVMAHEYINGSIGAVANYSKKGEMMKSTANMFFIGSTVSVDTFLVIGGLVNVYSFLGSHDRGVKSNILLSYAHRYIRLTPALGIVVLIHATLLKYFGNGPLWNAFDDHLVEPCRKHWWAALLYIQNYVHDEQACVPQSWYLSVDMQLFILSPLVLLLLIRKPKWALVGLVLLTLAGIVVPFTIAFTEELQAFMTGDDASTQKYIFAYYEQTYGRFGPYIMGMILGYIIYEIKKKRAAVKLRWFVVLALWAVCLSGALACVYAGHDTMMAPYDKWSHSLYIGFNRPAWSLAVSGIIFLCVSGYGGPVNVFLSAPIFQFLARISYAIYLVHYELILMRAYSYKTDIYIDHFYVFFNFWGDFMFSVALALLLYLTFESPMIAIEKLLFGKVTMKRTGTSKPDV